MRASDEINRDSFMFLKYWSGAGRRTAAEITTIAMVAITLVAALTAGTSHGQEATSMPTHLIIRFEARTEDLAEFAAIMDGVETGMQQEPGFVSATVYQHTDDPTVFTLVELWETRALHEEHYDRIVASGDWAHIKSLLRSEPQMGYFDKH